MKKYFLPCWMLLSLTSSFAQNLNWKLAIPGGIEVSNSIDAWAAGRVDDMLEFKNGTYMHAVASGGLWVTDIIGNPRNITPANWINVDMTNVERGPDGEYHIYAANTNMLAECNSPDFTNWTTIPLPLNNLIITSISVLNGERLLMVGTNQGILSSPIPLPGSPRTYNWTLGAGNFFSFSIHDLSAKSLTGAWRATETISSETSVNLNLAVVNRTPVNRHIFYLTSNGTLRTSFDTLGKGWSAQPQNASAPAGVRINSDLAVVSRTENRIDVFYAGLSGELKTTWWEPADPNWLAHHSTLLPPGTVSPVGAIVAVSRTPKDIDVFYTGQDSAIHHLQYNAENNQWTSPKFVSRKKDAHPATRIAVAMKTRNSLDVFWISPTGKIGTNWWVWYVRDNWNNFRWVDETGTAAPLAGIAACSRMPDQCDVIWSANDGKLMSAFWRNNPADPWGGSVQPVTGAGKVAPDGRLSLVSRHPLILTAFYETPEGNVETRFWDYTTGTLNSQSVSLGNHNGENIFNCWATSGFDDELCLLYRTNSGIFSRRWVTNSGVVLAGTAAGMVVCPNTGANAPGLVFNQAVLPGLGPNFSWTAVTLSKYGTAAYCSIESSTGPLDRNGGFRLNSIYKSVNNGGTWTACATGVEGGSSTLQTDAGGNIAGLNNFIAVSAVNNNHVAWGIVNNFSSTNGGASWKRINTDHVHADLHRIIPSLLDKSGNTFYFCTDGGISSTSDLFVNFFSKYNRGMATLYCYTTDSQRNFSGTLGLSPTTEGLIGTGTQDNGNNWAKFNDNTQPISCWHKMSPDPGGDGGFFSFIRDGSAVFFIQGLGTGSLARTTWNGTTFQNLGPIPVTRFPPGSTNNSGNLAGNFVAVNSMTIVPGTSQIYGYAWSGNAIYSYRSPSATQPWRLEFEAVIPMGPNEFITSASAPLQNEVCFGTDQGRLFYLNLTNGRGPQAMTLNPAGIVNPADFGVNRICMINSNSGYAIYTRWRDSDNTGFNRSYLLRWNGTTWSSQPLTLTSGATAGLQKFWGMDIDWTTNPPNLVLVSTSQAFMSRDGGNTWSLESIGLPPNNDIHLADVRFISWPNLGKFFFLSTYGRSVWYTPAP